MTPSAWRTRLHARLYGAGWSQPDGSWSFGRFGPEPLPGRRAALARWLLSVTTTSPAALLRRRLERLAWPPYDCDDCIGMREHGCYCAYLGSLTPGDAIDPSRYGWRLLHGLIFIWTSPFWDEVERTWTDHDVIA